ncbi:hypothetical protein [Vibrio harveyi]|uniref:hypothetical protein n=1 Tax=Vibrio harveyi TaxID=669 RepID=UPI00237FD90F|nr:hypothetical protein [Vibrio harveyi]
MRKLDFFKPSVAGVGFIGNGVNPDNYPLIYGRWKGIINKGYNWRYDNYTGERVYNDWHNFSNFAKWYIEQCDLLGIDPNKKNNGYVLNCTKGSIRGYECHSPSNTMLISNREQGESVANDLRFGEW